ncbi:MAG: flagellar basal body P-ring protein FlgI [Thermoguttaceae bacterium]
METILGKNETREGRGVQIFFASWQNTISMNTLFGNRIMTTFFRCFVFFVAISIIAFQSLTAAELIVDNVARIKGQEQTTISGYGIVSGLSSTGDDPKAYDPTLKAIKRTLEIAGMPHGTERGIGTSRNNALVRITATIPASGARDGTLLDCTVVSIGNAKSLAGGVLSISMLSGPISRGPEIDEPLGMASGSLTIENNASLNVAKIKQGCRLTGNFINPYIESGNITLVIHQQYATSSMSFDLAESINSVFGPDYGEIAKAINMNYVIVKLPTGYYSDPMKFVADLTGVPVVLTRKPLPRVIINERVGFISIGDDVEVLPTVIAHKNIVAEIRPPLPAGVQEINPNQFVDIDTETKYRQFMGEAVTNQKLKALQASLDAVRVPPQDMIEIIKGLQQQGKIVGEVKYID